MSGLGNETAVVWQDGSDVVMQLLIDNGIFVNVSAELIPAPASSSETQSGLQVVALANGNFVMTWTSVFNNASYENLAQIYDRNGNKVGSIISVFPLRQGTGDGEGAMFTTPDGGFGYVDTSNGTEEFQLFHADGSKNGGIVTGVTVDAVIAAAVLTNGNTVVLSQSPESNINVEPDSFTIYGPTGQTITTLPVRSDNFAFGGDLAALPDGKFVVVYPVLVPLSNGFAFTLNAQIFNSDGSSYLEISINNAALYQSGAAPRVAVMPDGRMIFSWFDTTGDANNDLTEVRVIALTGNPLTDIIAIPNSDETGDLVGGSSVAALNNTSFVVSWDSFSSITDQVFSLPPPRYLSDDFFGFGASDVLFRNTATGDTGFYNIVNGNNHGWIDVGATSTAYSVVGSGDFNGDGTSDILFRNNATGDTGFYEMVNGANAGWHDLGMSSTAYTVVGVGDFDGDGTADILFRNNATGDTGFYRIVNGVNQGWNDVGASSTTYSVVGVGDFNGDGTSDILYRNGTGDTGFYAIVNGVNQGWIDVGASSTAYSLVGVGDFNNDGTSDILFRNNTTGDTGFYAILNGANHGWNDVGASSTAYSVVGVGDYNHDGTDDILFRNDTNGDTGYYRMISGVNNRWIDIGASSTTYHVT